MNLAMAILEIEQTGQILIVKPVIDLHDIHESEIEWAVEELSERIDQSGVMDVFLDLHGTDVLHAQVQRFAVALWKRMRSHGGGLAIGLI